MNMKMKHTAILLVAGAACGTGFGAETGQKGTDVLDAQKAAMAKPIPQMDKSADKMFTWGGDIRLREVYFNNIPYPVGAQARGGENEFQRYRFRLWGEYHPTENLFFRARTTHEFRTGSKGAARKGWEYCDETVFDNLFVDLKAGDFALRVGRQDMIYGTGKLILDGTPKDGSRTIYFNAAKASYTGIENTTIDLFGMYMPSEDELAIHGQDRDLVGKTGGYYNGDEAGGGLYVKNKSTESLPFEAYYLIKTQEEEWARPGGPPTPFPPTPGANIPHDGETRHTVGTRLMPKFSDTLDANIELAYQTGEDISAYMVDALVGIKIGALEQQKAKVRFGWYHLSGDDVSTQHTDEGWNPLWARWPQYSELYVYGFDTDGAGRWSNLSMPHVDFSISPIDKLKIDLLLGYMWAPEADAVGGGHNRGWLFTWWNKYTLAEGLLSEKDKLFGHVLVELMEPGDYYSQAQRDEDIAAFLRFELSYSF